MDELRKLAYFVCGFKLENAPEEVVRAARFCVLDTVGSALGAARFEEIPALSAELSLWTASDSPRSAAVWGQRKRMDVFAALLVNGMLSHALELDDVHTGSKSHIGAVVVPAAWTMAEALGLPGKSFLEAVIVGYETMARIGAAMDVTSNRKRGWHTTGIIGTFGAAAAASFLLKLDEQRTLYALGMAGTQSSGLWAFLAEGSTCKKLHTARAAVNGVSAAILAKAGMTGPERILDAVDGGLYSAVSDSFDMTRVCADLGIVYQIMNIDKKPYPCCRSTHHAIDAALAIRKSKNFSVGLIDSILIRTYEVALLQCGSTLYPRNAVEAKFSVAYTCAVALIYGKVTLEEFGPKSLDDPSVRALSERIRVIEDGEFTSRYPSRWGCELEVIYKDGKKSHQRVDDMSGSVKVPLSERQELDKFTSLANSAFNDPLFVRETASNILRVEKLEQLPDLV
ncbi:MAG: MmgE/PrpD family protein [Treponemataceae bacterium]